MAGDVVQYDEFVEERFKGEDDLKNEYYKEVKEILDYNIRILRTEGVTRKVVAIYKKYLQAAISKEVLISISTKAIDKNKNFKRKLDPPPIGFEITPTVDEVMNYIREQMKRIMKAKHKQQERSKYNRTFGKISVNPFENESNKNINRPTQKTRRGLTRPSNKYRKTLELSRRTYHRGVSFNPKTYTRRIPPKEANQSYTGRIPSSKPRISKPLFSHYTRKGRLPRVIESPPRKKTAFNRFRNTARNSMSKVRGFFRL